MTLFTSISATTQYLVLNRVPFDYGLLLFLLGISSSWLGQKYILRYAKKTGRSSLLVFAIAFIIVVSAILLCVPGGMNVARDIKNHKPMGFMPLCGN